MKGVPKMSRKMLFFDIDGTLVPEYTNDVPLPVQDAIKEAMAQGHLAFINTGRTMMNIHKNLKNIGFSGYCGGCGTEIYLGDETLYFFELSKEDCYEIATYFHKHNISVLYEASHALYVSGPVQDHRDLKAVEEMMDIRYTHVNTEEDRKELHFSKILYWAPNHIDDKEVQQFLSKWFDIIDRGNDMREVVPHHHTKATAIDFLCKHFNIPLEDCYAFGDSTNDISMLKHVPHGIAMGKCMEEILPYVEYRTDTVENNGIVKAMKHYQIIK